MDGRRQHLQYPSPDLLIIALKFRNSIVSWTQNQNSKNRALELCWQTEQLIDNLHDIMREDGAMNFLYLHRDAPGRVYSSLTRLEPIIKKQKYSTQIWSECACSALNSWKGLLSATKCCSLTFIRPLFLRHHSDQFGHQDMEALQKE